MLLAYVRTCLLLGYLLAYSLTEPARRPYVTLVSKGCGCLY